MFAPIDQYCERLDASLLAEPLGFSSNFAFFPAAWLIFRLSQKHADPFVSKILRLLALLSAAIGGGSSFFHAWPNVLSLIADVGPIAALALVFAVSYLVLLHGEKVRSPLVPVLLLIGLPILIVRLLAWSHYLAGGEFYLGLAPAMLWLARVDPQTLRAQALRRAAFIFIAALTARTIDQYLCPWWPHGTHFLWHLLNAWVVYQLASTLSLSRPTLQTQ